MWRWLCLGLCALGLMVGLRFVWASELSYLSAEWLPDDAFYYLQPARSFAELGTFSFDGSHPTYGFHPLWMLTLSALGILIHDADTFLRAALTLGVLSQALCAYLAYAWLGAGRRGLVGATLILLNPGIFHLLATGMEATLVAPLLLGLLILRKAPPPGLPWALAMGALVGLLALARVEMLLLGLLLVPSMGLGSREHKQATLATLAGVALVCLPWALFAYFELGALLPTSGARRLMGGPAGLGLWIVEALPFMEGPIMALLSPLEGDLLRAKAAIKPSLANLGEVGILGALKVAWGFWIPFAQGGGARALALLPGVVLLGGWALKDVTAPGFGEQAEGAELKGRSKGRPLKESIPPGLVILMAFALARMVALQLFMPAYAGYAFWYRVPEVIALVGALAWGVEGLLVGIEAVAEGRGRGGVMKIAGVYGALILLGSAYVYGGILGPRVASETGSYGSRALVALAWMEESLPKGARVGAWNAGLMGYFAEGIEVVNLDGLANSPEYLEAVIPNEMRLRAGMDVGSAGTLAYLREEGVEYLADAEHPDRLGMKAFQEVIPPESYIILHRVPGLLRWDGPTPTHQLAVIELQEADTL